MTLLSLLTPNNNILDPDTGRNYLRLTMLSLDPGANPTRRMFTLSSHPVMIDLGLRYYPLGQDKYQPYYIIIPEQIG